MRSVLLTLSLLATLLYTGCKKVKEEAPSVLETITIDGQDYPIVKIGNQTWTAANYKSSGGIAGANPNYGKLYTYAEFQAIMPPSGWRKPAVEDYRKLIESLGGTWQINGVNGFCYNSNVIKKIVAKEGWNYQSGTNETGFNAPPAGYIPMGGGYAGLGYMAGFWATKNIENNPVHLIIEVEEGSGYHMKYWGWYSEDPVARFAVRFVKDN